MIEVKKLTKFYGDHKAVDNLSFSVKDGTVCGFLGPNGAGKSTTMNIMTGCLSATAGSVSISGHDIFEEPIEAKKMIGYLPEQPPLYVEETPREYLRFVAEAKRIPEGKGERRNTESNEGNPDLTCGRPAYQKSLQGIQAEGGDRPDASWQPGCSHSG